MSDTEDKIDYSTRIHEDHTFRIHDSDGKAIAGADVRMTDGTQWLTNVWVDGKHRKKGMARAVVKAAIDCMGDKTTYLQVSAYTDKAMSDADLTKFYRSFGFEPTTIPTIMVRHK